VHGDANGCGARRRAAGHAIEQQCQCHGTSGCNGRGGSDDGGLYGDGVVLEFEPDGADHRNWRGPVTGFHTELGRASAVIFPELCSGSTGDRTDDHLHSDVEWISHGNGDGESEQQQRAATGAWKRRHQRVDYRDVHGGGGNHQQQLLGDDYSQLQRADQDGNGRAERRRGGGAEQCKLHAG